MDCTERVPGDWREGVPFHWVIQLADGAIEIKNYHLSVAMQEEACRAAGFSSIRWHPLRVSPQGESACEKGYWTELLAQGPLVGLECVKAP